MWRLATDNRVVTGFVWHGGPGLRHWNENRSEVLTSQTTQLLYKAPQGQMLSRSPESISHSYMEHPTRHNVWFTAARNKRNDSKCSSSAGTRDNPKHNCTVRFPSHILCTYQIITTTTHRSIKVIQTNNINKHCSWITYCGGPGFNLGLESIMTWFFVVFLSYSRRTPV
jgi:hypothetical protein